MWLTSENVGVVVLLLRPFVSIGMKKMMSFIISSLSLCIYEDRQRKKMSIEAELKTKKNSDQGVQFQVFPIF